MRHLHFFVQTTELIVNCCVASECNRSPTIIMNPTHAIVTNDSIFKSIENFITICHNAPSDFGRLRDKLHSILNELNSIDFKYNQTPNVNKVRTDSCRRSCHSNKIISQNFPIRSLPMPFYAFCRKFRPSKIR